MVASRQGVDGNLEVLDRWLEREFMPEVLEFDVSDTYPTALVEQIRPFGLFGATVPDACGRLGLGSRFSARRSDGYESARRPPTLGHRAVDTVELHFDAVQVEEDQLIGGVEGKGFAHEGARELDRINVAACGVRLAIAALKASINYSKVRKTMGQRTRTSALSSPVRSHVRLTSMPPE